MLHLAFGCAFAFLYAFVFESLQRATLWLGALLGLYHGLFMLVVVMSILPSMHPCMASKHHGPTPTRQLEPPGFLALNYGTEPFLASLLASVILLTMHWLFATASLHSERLRKVITGDPYALIRDGEVQEEGLRRSRISESMLRENLRSNCHLTDPAQVREAYYEPSGNVSVIPKEDTEPHVVEVGVREGVQTVRIVLHDQNLFSDAPPE